MSISENVGGMSNYLGSLRTADGYLNLKTAVTDSLNRVPVYGEASWQAGSAGPRMASSSCLFQVCFLKTWVLLTWDLWTDMISIKG